MMNKGRIIRIIPAFLLIVLLVGVGCSSKEATDFSIYPLKNDTPVSKITSLDGLEPADQPVIGMKDIVSYNKETHEMEITPEAFKRITELRVPVQGKAFAACLDGRPVYWGAFWTPVSSISFNGIMIMKPLMTSTPVSSYIIQIEPGYPSAQFFKGSDPRNNADILAVLEKAGKLK
jgi:hypothetical protein